MGKIISKVGAVLAGIFTSLGKDMDWSNIDLDTIGAALGIDEALWGAIALIIVWIGNKAGWKWGGS